MPLPTADGDDSRPVNTLGTRLLGWGKPPNAHFRRRMRRQRHVACPAGVVPSARAGVLQTETPQESFGGLVARRLRLDGLDDPKTGAEQLHEFTVATSV